MTCEILSRLTLRHAEALTAWTNVGGTNPGNRLLPAVAAAFKDVEEAEQAVLKHRHEHGC
jgi:hypothetical protein